MKTLLIAAAALALGGCASTPSPSARSVQDGDPAVVNRDCKLLGTVTGRSLFSGIATKAADNAAIDAREKAAAMGATHVVFINVDTSGTLNTGQATARAYRCDARR